MGRLNISAVPGIAAVQLSPNVFDIALTNTDISFTLYPNYKIKDLSPDDHILMIYDASDEQASIIKWVGSIDCFIPDLKAFCKLVNDVEPKRFAFNLVIVEKVDPANNQFVGINVSKNSRWLVEIDANNTIDITTVM